MATKKTEESKFPKEELRKHCKQLFGVEPEVFDGAFLNEKGTFTKEDGKKKIETFLKKEVK